jgi:diaminopimelate decarboxylase
MTLALKEELSGSTAPGSPEAMTPVRVPAAIHQSISRFLEDRALVKALVDGFGSPLNIIFPRHIRDNIARFQAVFAERQLQGRLYYTHKPNKSQALVREAALAGVGLDVTSDGELFSAMKAGFHPSRIEATGPQSRSQIALCLQQGIMLNVDNLQQLAQAEAMQRALGRREPHPIMVRVDGFTAYNARLGGSHDTMFGVPVADISTLFDALEGCRDVFSFQGFAYHSHAGGDLPPKIAAAEICLQLTFEAQKRGLRPRALNVGGGYRTSYAESAADWHRFTEALKKSVLETGPKLTWDNMGLGYRNEGGVLRGNGHFIEHFLPSWGATDLAAMLDAPLPSFDGMSCARLLSENFIEIMAEPGRALLDQTGLTLGRVAFVKSSMHGDTLVGLEMNSTNINAGQSKFLTDPVVIPLAPRTRSTCPEGVLYMGNLCMSENMMVYRKTFPEFLPKSGDVVAFINTAAYRMDTAESNVLQQRLAEKVAVIETGEGFRWFRDELYSPLTLMTEDQL